ncbi:unnamed protein product [Urochloa humidicola]
MASAFDFDDGDSAYLSVDSPEKNASLEVASGFTSLRVGERALGEVGGGSGLSVAEKMLDIGGTAVSEPESGGAKPVDVVVVEEFDGKADSQLAAGGAEIARDERDARQRDGSPAANASPGRGAGSSSEVEEDEVFDYRSYMCEVKELHMDVLARRLAVQNAQFAIGMDAMCHRVIRGETSDQAELEELRGLVAKLKEENDVLAREKEARKDQVGELEGSVRLLREQNNSISLDNERLKKKCDQQEESLENLRKQVEEDSLVVKELTNEAKSHELAMRSKDKVLAERDAKIAELEVDLLKKTSLIENHEDDIWQRGLRSHRLYREALQQFGAEPQDVPREMTVDRLFHWLDTEFRMLPETLSRAGDYGASVSSGSLLQMLECLGCEHFMRLGTQNYNFPTAEQLANESATCTKVKNLFLRKFWVRTGRAIAKGQAAERLGKFYLSQQKEALRAKQREAARAEEQRRLMPPPCIVPGGSSSAPGEGAGDREEGAQ